MDIGAGSASKAVKEIMNEFGLQIANQTLSHLGVHHGGGASTKVDGGQSQSFVHWHNEIACAKNSSLRSQRFVESLAKNDAYVFHSVMLVHVKIAPRAQFEVEASVPREQLQHVVEKADASGHFVFASAQPISFTVSCNAATRRSV